jgi:hypothetical protein
MFVIVVVGLVIGLSVGLTRGVATDDTTTTTTTDALTTAPAPVYPQLCFTLIGFDTTNVCWNGTDYCSYPLDLAGINGTLAYTFEEVAAFVGFGYEINTATGCWSQVVSERRRDEVRPALPIRVGLPPTYMIFSSTPYTADRVTSIPLRGYGQTEYESSNVDIDWGDGTIERHMISSAGVLYNHTYAVGDTAAHVIRIAGTAHSLCHNALDSAYVGLLVNVTQWGNVVTYQMNFYDELRLGPLIVTATDGPNPSLVNIDFLFGVPLNLLVVSAQYDGRVDTFAGWALTSVVTATQAFSGLNMTTGAVLPNTLASTLYMYYFAIMPSNVTLRDNVFTISESMFLYAVCPGTMTVTNISSAVPSHMFWGVTFAGAVAVTNCNLTSPFQTFGRAEFSGSLTLQDTVLTGDAFGMFYASIIAAGVDMSAMDVSGVTDGTWMFFGMRIGGAYTSPGVFSSCTSANSMYYGTGCIAEPCAQWDMTGISLPIVTDATWAFFMDANGATLSNVPNLDMSQATQCENLFHAVTFSERFVPVWPAMKCPYAVRMFYETTFTQGADFSGMNVSQTVADVGMFESSVHQGDVGTVYPGPFTMATDVTTMFRSSTYTATPNWSAVAFPAAITLTMAFRSVTKLCNLTSLGVSDAAVTCTNMFEFGTFLDRFTPVWPNMRCTTGSGMFNDATFTAGVDMSGMNVALVVTATSMLRSGAHQGAVASILPGPYTAATNTITMLQFTTFTTAPDMTLISIPSSLDASAMFHACGKITAMPDLNPISVVTASTMFKLATMAADMGVSTLAWSFPSLQTANNMFEGTNFASLPFYMHTWGMGNVRTLSNFANTATNVPSTIDVSTWQMQQLTTLSGFFFGVNAPSLVLNLTLWSTTRLTSMASAFASMGNVQLVGVHNLDVSRVTDMQNLFDGTPMTAEIVLNTWNTTSLTIATSAFQTSIGTSVDISTWNTINLSVAGTMFQTTNVNPNMTSWSLVSIVSASNILDQCYISTPALYSQVLIAFAERSNGLVAVLMGAPRSNLLVTTGNLPTRVEQGYDSSGSAAHATLLSLGWQLDDGGLM